MRHAIAVVAAVTFILLASPALAQAGDWGTSTRGQPIELDRLEGFPDPLPIGEANPAGERVEYRQLRVHTDGVIEFGDADEQPPDGPGPLALQAAPVIAPFWFDFDGKCEGRPTRNDARFAVEDGVLVIRWLDMTVGGTACDEDAELFDFEARLEIVPADAPGGVGGLRVTFIYGALPWGEAPRVGVALPVGVIELMPDGAKGVPRTERAVLLAEGGSEGVRGGDGTDRVIEAGVWVIELGFDGQLRGDPDADGVRGPDNCPDDFNPAQQNFRPWDAEGVDTDGDACDSDHDNDFRENDVDNCVWVGNRNQADADGDGRGDRCDPDRDGDGVPNWSDNCPIVPNPAQLDMDYDARGDRCDPDPDGDGWPTLPGPDSAADTCPWVANSVQVDSDGDGMGDACDTRPARWADEEARLIELDSDGDRWPDTLDICPWAADVAQLDTDGDGVGDACDPDADDDGTLDIYQGRCFSSALGLVGDCRASEIGGTEWPDAVDARVVIPRFPPDAWRR